MLQIAFRKNRARVIALHNKKTNLVTPNFTVGDFVVVRRAQDRGHKLRFKWTEPRRITGVLSDLVYEISGLVEDKIEIFHASRILLYKPALDNATVSERTMQHAAHTEAKYEINDELMDIKKKKIGDMFVLTRWVGLPDKCDFTWQSLKELHEDVPDMLKKFLSNYESSKR